MRPGWSRVLVAGEAKDLVPDAVCDALQRMGGSNVHITITAVAARRPWLASWAPMSGLVTLDQIDKDTLLEACEAARRCTATLPGDASVRYWAASGWSAALERGSEHEMLLVIGRPRRRRDRRAVARATVAQSVV